MRNASSWWHKGKEYGIDTVHSPDDRGYYAEIWDMKTGKQLHATRVYTNDRAARRGAELWIEGHC